MSFISWMKRNITEARDSMNAEIVKFKSKELLEAIVASSAMVAYVNGAILPEEKQKLMGYLRSSEQLKHFDQNDVIKMFQRYVEKYEFDATIATGEVMTVVSKFKGKPQAQLVVRVCCAIGAADGDFDDDEKAVVKRMCLELELNPEDFEL